MKFYDEINWVDWLMLSSALQKTIRRGQVSLALSFAKELIRRGFASHVHKRLFVYLVEDIWWGNIWLVSLVDKFLLNKIPSENELLKIVGIFAQSPKNRDVHNIRVCNKHKLISFDEDLKSVLKGRFCYSILDIKKLLVANSSALDEYLDKEGLFGGKIIQDNTGKEIYHKITKQILDISQYLLKDTDEEISYSYIRVIKHIREQQTWFDIYFYLIMFWIIKNSNLIQHKPVLQLDFDLSKYDFEKLERIPDYAIDMHTKKWKILGKTQKDFWLEWWIIENKIILFEDDIYFNLIMKNLDKITNS